MNTSSAVEAPTVRRLQLTEVERDALGRLVDAFTATDRSADPLSFAEQAPAYAVRLPERVREFLGQVRADEVPVSVISGLPLQALPPTPLDWTAAAAGVGRREELLLVLCGLPLGEPFGWAAQQGGRLVHDVCPSPAMEQSLTSACSAAPLSLHTEDGFHPCRGDYVSLLCLRNPDAVRTTFVRIGSLGLPDKLQKILQDSRFRFLPDDAHVAGACAERLRAAPDGTGLDPIIFGPPEHPYLRFDVDFTAVSDGDDEAAAAMADLDEQLRAATESVALAPGDLLFIDNYQVVHGRAPFRARYDGTDRWLKRLNLIRDLRRIYATADTRSRIIR
ncbi:TauD/TfdA family dioxygenase [Micromonospora sp. WMMD1128]|uniref:TauD/TfdA family dioxygenase n=1 Tax=unclassified Micromonospora TaxID=2617518 RepID=UPI00248CA964|nr:MULTISPECIES: TauD/TfdA family dioxygenase [unclassified Micromonospora]WBB75704.1 TauD/TfdA family dioxygenase [Micromonospora sp. WMMD1128]WFE36508.1 TauD/TfdA family dioxygenase [Micromonospora sp. WMMD975]